MNTAYVLTVFVAMMAVTFALRALPFVAADWLMKHPFVRRLQDFLPLAIMALLVLHSGFAAAAGKALGALAVIAATALTALLQWRLKNPLASICCGTALFVALVHLVR